MYQIVEIVQQLRGECNETQVDGAKIGMGKTSAEAAQLS